MSKEFEVFIARSDLLEAFIHLAGDFHSLSRVTWFGQITSFSCHHGFSNTKSLIQVLGSMPLLEIAEVKLNGTWDETYNYRAKLTNLIRFTLSVSNKILGVSLLMFLGHMPVISRLTLGFGELDDAQDNKAVPLIQTLKEVVVIGDNSHAVNVVSLVSLLRRMPSLSKVSILNMQLRNGLKGPSVCLSKSLKAVKVSGLSSKGYLLNVKPLVSLLSCMPALTKLSLQRVELVGEYDGEIVLSESLTKLKLSENETHIQGMASLVSLVRCMPELAHMSLVNIQLSGELGIYSVLRTSMEKLKIESKLSGICTTVFTERGSTNHSHDIRGTKSIDDSTPMFSNPGRII